MNGDFIDLHDWAAWKFGQFEYRLCGYIQRDNVVRCIITEPILGINVDEAYVETTNNLKFKLHRPIDKVNMMDMSYVLDRWMNINLKGEPWNATEMVLESLRRQESGQEMERAQDVPHEEPKTKTNKSRGSRKKKNETNKEEDTK